MKNQQIQVTIVPWILGHYYGVQVSPQNKYVFSGTPEEIVRQCRVDRTRRIAGRPTGYTSKISWKDLSFEQRTQLGRAGAWFHH